MDFSICIKFTEKSNWRPYCRQFDDGDECREFINKAFEDWPVKHVSVFKDGKFLHCYWFSPKMCAQIHALNERLRHDRQRLYGNYINR